MTETMYPEPRIKILHVTFNMGIGGTEQVIRQLVQSLDASHFENEVVCIDGEIGALGKELQSAGVVTHTLSRTGGVDLELVKSLRSLIRLRNANILHCHQYTPYFYGWMAHWGTQCKVVFTEHGRFHPDKRRVKACWLNPVMALTTPSIVSISSATRTALQTYEFIPSFKVKVIYNGIAVPAYQVKAVEALKRSLGIQPDELVLGTVARLDGVKNQHLMIRALKRLREKDIPVRLMLVGDGPERRSLEQTAADLGMTDYVLFTGFITEPANHLACMDVFLLTSYTEGTSMTLLEAMSLGIPSVATAVGGNVEILVDNETGKLIPSDDESALVDVLTQLYHHPHERQRLAGAAKAAFEARFSSAQMAYNYQAVYSRILGKEL